MPKLKSHKGAAKRVRVSAKGKCMHKRAGRRHLLSGKPGKRRRRLRRKDQIKGAQAATTRHMLAPGL